MNEENILQRDALKAIALRERIGQIVSNYEEELADIRAQATMQAQNSAQRIQDLSEQVEKLTAQIASDVAPKMDQDVVSEEA